MSNVEAHFGSVGSAYTTADHQRWRELRAAPADQLLRELDGGLDGHCLEAVAENPAATAEVLFLVLQYAKRLQDEDTERAPFGAWYLGIKAESAALRHPALPPVIWWEYYAGENSSDPTWVRRIPEALMANPEAPIVALRAMMDKPEGTPGRREALVNLVKRGEFDPTWGRWVREEQARRCAIEGESVDEAYARLGFKAYDGPTPRQRAEARWREKRARR